MKDIKLTLSVDETNMILESLGSMPFNKVFEIIGKIQKQASEQLSENVKAAKAANGK